MTIKYTAIPTRAIFDEGLTPQQLRTLCVIAYYGSLSDRVAYPSYNTIAKDVGVGRRLIIRYMKILVDLGYIEKTKRARAGKQATNIYSVPLNIEIAPDLGDEVEKMGGGGVGSLDHLGKVMKISGEVVAPSTTTPSGAQHHPPSGAQHHPNQYLLNKEKNINKYNTKKSAKLTLAQWEAKIGSEFRIEMMGEWVKTARVGEDAVRALITEFREKVSAGGNQYADFTAAFKVWLRSGYLSKKLEELQPKAKASRETEIWDKGMRL